MGSVCCTHYVCIYTLPKQLNFKFENVTSVCKCTHMLYFPFTANILKQPRDMCVCLLCLYFIYTLRFETGKRNIFVFILVYQIRSFQGTFMRMNFVLFKGWDLGLGNALLIDRVCQLFRLYYCFSFCKNGTSNHVYVLV